MKKWKAYIEGYSFNFSRLYDEVEFEVSDEEYVALEEAVAKNKPLTQLPFYSDLITRAEKAEKEFLKSTYEEDNREDYSYLSESELEEMNQEDFEDIESLVYDTIIDDPNDKKHFENDLYKRQYKGWENSAIVLKSKLKDGIKATASFELQTDENGRVEYVSDVKVECDPETISFTVDEINPHPYYSYLLEVADNVLGRNRFFEDDFGYTEFPYEVSPEYYDELKKSDYKKSYSTYLRSVRVAIAWEYKGEEHFEERTIRLPDHVIADICENGYDTLSEVITESGFYAADRVIKAFEVSHPNAEYQEYLRNVEKGDLKLNYAEWIDTQGPNAYFDIMVSEFAYELKERLLDYKVDVYLGDKYLETLQLELNTDTSTILKLIDAYNDKIPVERDGRLKEFRNKIDIISKSRQQSISEKTMLEYLIFKVETPKEIKDIAAKYIRPSYKGIQEEEEKPKKLPEEKKVVKVVAKIRDTDNEIQSVRVEKKTTIKPKSNMGLKLALGAILAVMVAAGIFVYTEYFTAKSPMYFDRNQLGSVVIDGNYDVFDVTYKTPEDWKFTVDDLGYWQYLKLWNQSEEVEETEDSIRVTYYDKDGKQLEEIICYNDERIRINGVLCKPDIPANQGFALPGVLKSYGKGYMQEALRPEIEKMMKKAKADNGSIIIEMIDIPFDGGTYLRMWGLRTDATTGKDKNRILFDKTAQEYHHVAGHKLLIPLKEFLNGEKLYDMWISIEACGVSFGYDISEIIPKELRAK